MLIYQKTISEIIFKLRNLQELNVSENYLSELNRLVELKNLQILNIGWNDFKTFPNEITKLKKLKKLDIWWNDIRTFPKARLANPENGLNLVPNPL